MTEVPKRESLVSQATDILRREIRRGEWTGFLPGEIELCARLQVSRPTLRAALGVLQRDGLIEVSQGRRRRILGVARAPSKLESSRTVGFLTPLSYHLLSSFTLFLMNELQTRLHDMGYRLEVYAHMRYRTRQPSKALDELTARSRAAIWVLNGPTLAMQRWFAASGLPALVVGGSPTNLPCLGVDQQAAARHAVGLFLARGHKNIALVCPQASALGDDPALRGFEEGCEAARQKREFSWTVGAHNGTAGSIVSALNSLLRARTPPTALLVSRPKHVLTVMSHLMNSGVRLPDNMSLISLGYEPILDEMIPSVAHYEINRTTFARRLLRRVSQIMHGDVSTSSHILLLPQFRDGDTLKTVACQAE